MRATGAGLVLSAMVVVCHGPATAQDAAARATAWTFTNPLDVKVADPCIVRFDDVYHLYGTAARPAEADLGIPVWTSTDLVRWRAHGRALSRGADAWGQQWFWGPEVRKVGDSFLMYYGAFRKDGECPVGRICVARARSAVGPFTDERAPMFDWTGPGDLIDPFPFDDAGGAPYLCFVQALRGRNTIWVVRLKADRLSLDGVPRQVLEPGEPWEVEPVDEGPFVWRSGDAYRMLFSINDFRRPWYGVGLAEAQSPLGPWTKRAAGPVLRRGPDLVGPGCAGLISSPDGRERWAYYHVHLTPDGYQRQLALSRVGGSGDAFRIDAPTRDPQAAPSGSPAPPPLASDPFAAAELDLARWTIVDEDPAAWHAGGGALSITAQDGDMWRDRADYRNLFLQSAPVGDVAVSVRVRAEVTGDHELACLVAWQDADNYVRLSTVWAGGPRLSAAVELNGVYEEALVPNTFGPEVTLRLTRRGDRWTFEARGGGEWVTVGAPRDARLAMPRAGVAALAPGTKRRFDAVFRDFKVHAAR
jgi:GH43 family beta-xylosidase